MINVIERNLLTIKNKISTACKIYNKDLNSVKLIAVSKNCDEEKIINAINCGCKIFGENYIQEAKDKWQKIKKDFPDYKAIKPKMPLNYLMLSKLWIMKN